MAIVQALGHPSNRNVRGIGTVRNPQHRGRIPRCKHVPEGINRIRRRRCACTARRPFFPTVPFRATRCLYQGARVDWLDVPCSQEIERRADDLQTRLGLVKGSGGKPIRHTFGRFSHRQIANRISIRCDGDGKDAKAGRVRGRQGKGSHDQRARNAPRPMPRSATPSHHPHPLPDQLNPIDPSGRTALVRRQGLYGYLWHAASSISIPRPGAVGSSM